MNAVQIHVLLALVLFASMVAPPLHATELTPLTSTELHELCLAFVHRPLSEDARACAAYVRGFIEGSDDVIVEGDDAQQRSQESFSERAWRTRLGVRTAEPLYCVSTTLPLRALVAQLLTQAERKPAAEHESASTLLYATLSRFHRCSR